MYKVGPSPCVSFLLDVNSNIFHNHFHTLRNDASTNTTMKSTAVVILMHLMVALTTATTVGHLDCKPTHYDWHKGKYITKLQNPGNDCQDGAWGFVSIDGEVLKIDHKVCNITSLHQNVVQRNSDTRRKKRGFPNPTIIAGTITVIAGTVVEAQITLGAIVSLGVIGAYVGGILFGVAWVGRKIVDTISSRDELSEPRQIKKGMYLIPSRAFGNTHNDTSDGSELLSPRDSEQIAVCAGGLNSDETVEDDDKSNRNVDNAKSIQCAQENP